MSIKEMIETAKNGDVITIPAGTYTLSALKVDKPIKIKGAK